MVADCLSPCSCIGPLCSVRSILRPFMLLGVGWMGGEKSQQCLRKTALCHNACITSTNMHAWIHMMLCRQHMLLCMMLCGQHMLLRMMHILVPLFFRRGISTSIKFKFNPCCNRLQLGAIPLLAQILLGCVGECIYLL